MSKKFSHQYKLKKDLPTYPKGWKISWDGDRFYPFKKSTWKHDEGKESIYRDREHTGYTVDEIKNTEWFEPNSPEVDFIPKFPDSKSIDEFVYLEFDLRKVDTVDECRAMGKLFESNKFQKDLYEFVKAKYDKFYLT